MLVTFMSPALVISMASSSEPSRPPCRGWLSFSKGRESRCDENIISCDDDIKRQWIQGHRNWKPSNRGKEPSKESCLSKKLVQGIKAQESRGEKRGRSTLPQGILDVDHPLINHRLNLCIVAKAFALAASIIAVIRLSDRIISVTKSFLRDVRDAPAELRALVLDEPVFPAASSSPFA